MRPLLRDEDVLRERDIIVEEIRSYRDDPGQYVFDLFDRSFYGDTPLGREIAGDEASVADRRRAAHPGFLGGRRTSPRTWSWRSPATCPMSAPWSSSRRASGPARAPSTRGCRRHRHPATG